MLSGSTDTAHAFVDVVTVMPDAAGVSIESLLYIGYSIQEQVRGCP